MKKYTGGTAVTSGIYWSYANGRCITAGETPVVLPGDGSYINVPAIFFVIAGPILGLAFVLFLPFIGFAFMGYHAVVLLGHKLMLTPAAETGRGAQKRMKQ